MLSHPSLAWQQLHTTMIILAKEENKQNQTLRKSACVCNGVPASGSPSSPLPPTSCRQPEAELTTVETALWAPQVQVARRARSHPIPAPILTSRWHGGSLAGLRGPGWLQTAYLIAIKKAALFPTFCFVGGEGVAVNGLHGKFGLTWWSEPALSLILHLCVHPRRDLRDTAPHSLIRGIRTKPGQ